MDNMDAVVCINHMMGEITYIKLKTRVNKIIKDEN